MMAQALQGIQQQYAPSGLPVQKRYTKETAAQILQLDNMDSDTSPVRLIIKRKIVTYLKGREQFYNLHPRYLLAVSKSIDEQLYKDAESKIHYMDFETLEVRLNALLSRGSFGNSRYALASSASLPTSHSEQLGIKVTDSSIQNGRAVPGSVNPPPPARDISHNVLYSQGFAPTSHHDEAAASFAHSSADKIKQGPESLANATDAPCVSSLPKCSPCIAGDFSGGVPTGHTKYHFPGDVHQVDSQQPSTSGSSSSVSAMCDRTANSTNNNRYSAGQVSSSLQCRECGKVLYTRSHPIEESDQSNITAGSHDLYIHDQSKIRTDIKRECGLEGCMQMDETCFCREKCSTLNTKFSYDQCSYIAADSGNCVSIREAVKGAEQTSNSTVSKPTSPTSDESSGKHHPAKRLRINSPRPVHADKTKFPKELQPAANGTDVSSETVHSETTALPTKSPSGCSLLDSNASNNMEIIRLPETAMQAEEGLCHGNGDIEMKELSCYGNGDIEMKEGLCYENGDIEMKNSKLSSVDQTSLVACLTATKKRGGSILYALTAEELRDHMKSLNQHICPSQMMTEEHPSGLPDQNTCNLCGMERILFEPPPRFCALCFKIINSTGSYYVHVENGIDKASICAKCHHLSTAKFKYHKRSNYAETDAEAEWWVECDKCKAWQHQICALFNPKVADEEVEYTCAKCLLKERDIGDITLLESPTVLGALELPRTKLSDHIEQRLSVRLEHERLQRARASGKDIEEVPGVEGLTVKVVSSAARVLQVQPRFRDFFKDGKYPGEFPYKSKAILLFQKNEGVDVCLFAMYVQEYGSDSPLPNRRHVYLAYIDSVKYFRPEIKSASGEALRTFVYHEILIGYLDYCKKIGFVSCSIWACPSTKRDDYVLYCHPTSQKMPKSDKLRSWYQNLIKKAVKDGVVVERNTLYDFFLQPTSDRKASISAACLPYCENDFWPGEAERLLEKKDDNTSQKKEPQVGRLMRVAKRDDRKGNLEDNLEDILLVHKLGEKMRTMKEDFIMLCLQRFCKHCHQPIVSGKSWVCTCCKNFHLCEQCHAEELSAPLKDRHPATTKQKHAFQRIEEEPLPDTDDGDPTMESKYFDSRIDFLKHCQDNQYQFDTLRRAKHSTMMILYHLHDSACSACHRTMDQRFAWRCLVCAGCTFCDSCYKQDGEKLHIHKLKQTDNQQVLPNYTLQQDYLEGLVHASKCFCAARSCAFKLCFTMKKLFFHGVRCDIRNRGGCRKCIFMWKLLLTHAKHCGDGACSVPRCRDIKAFFMDKAKMIAGPPCAVEC
ncbi:probable histone acetyltransferase HAC-like 3 isoform X3 [Triticum aestivum]|uniref:probable histone acetyltransferase HAC-like 3 isoform X3 n=1 Tax=Triticum aestivum TaxID=4565 RepID=UPI001D0333AC|nr:probable histone acetyltransferase HAC-like 3 isoform X3 [Triticum aestivum]